MCHIGEAAAKLAKVMVERGDRYAFVSGTIPGSHMFSVKSREGVIYVTLNIDHPAYESLARARGIVAGNGGFG